MIQPHGDTPGKVYLVGAGPGDPQMITIRAGQCLGRADLVLYDHSVNPVVLEHAPPSAELVCVGHCSNGRAVPQPEANARMIAAARRGKNVVRLEDGDPSVFGHAAEEIEALRAAGIPFEVVPGVTAALAAAGYAGIPITHGQHCSAVALITAQERIGKSGSPGDYGALAEFPGTLIFYMGVTTAREWTEALLLHGKEPETPVAIVRRSTWPDQQTIRCTLGTVADLIDRQKLCPPAVIVVGEVAALAPEVSWFSARPLFGTRVLITRPRDQADRLRQRLSELGAETLLQPVIQITGPPDWGPADQALEKLHQYDWLVFSSAHGVRYLLERLHSIGGDLRRLGPLKLAAIGPGTAEELSQYHLRADLVPEQYRAEALADALAGEARGRRFLLARASRGREVLGEKLTAAGGLVDQVVVYSSTDLHTADPDVADRLSAGCIDWITVTSSAIARSLVELFGDDLRRSKLASISPITSQALRQLGHQPAAEATEYTMEGLVEAILNSR